MGAHEMDFELRKNWFSLLLIIIVIIMGLEIVYLMDQNRKLRGVISNFTYFTQTLGQDDSVPPFSATDLNGEIVEIAYSPGQPYTLLMWFSSSCSACDDNLRFWNELYLDYNSGRVRMLGVYADDSAAIHTLAEEYNLVFPIVGLDDQSLVEAYNGYTLPQTMLISPQGSVRKVWRGSLDEKRRESVISAVAQVKNLTGKGGDI
jgi:peroxiredoxin